MASKMIEHYTSLESALNILKTGHFIPSKISADRGLNCFIISDKKYTNNNRIENNNAKMIFCWTGDTLRVEDMGNYQQYAGKLLDQYPWRAILYGPMQKQNKLYLTSIECNDFEELDVYLRSTYKHCQYKYLCWSERQKKAYHNKFIQEINKVLKNAKISITID